MPFVLLLLTAAAVNQPTAAPSFRIELHGYALRGAPLPGVTITAVDAAGNTDSHYTGTPEISGLRFLENDQPAPPRFKDGTLTWETVPTADQLLTITAGEITVRDGARTGRLSVHRIPGWLSLLPPVVAVVLAVTFRRVFVALAAGVFSGALVLSYGNPFLALWQTIGHFLFAQFINLDHLQVILFTIFIGSMVGVMSRSGGTHGIVGAVSPFAYSSRRGQFIGWLLGLLIFFDDYANSLLIGTTLRPLTDRLRVSREKLAYIVDSTAAPVAGIALISTWVGTEIGYIQDTYAKLGLGSDVYYTFLATIPYRFYALLAILFVLLVACMGRDLGPMLAAERRAALEHQPYRVGAQIPPAAKLDHLNPPAHAPLRWINALAPIALVIVVVMLGLYYMGTRKLIANGAGPGEFTLRNIIGSANSYPVLLVASLAGSILAAVMAWWQGILTVGQCAGAWLRGGRAMLLAVAILVLAWALSAACDTDNLNTAWYVVEQTQDYISARWMPVAAFVLAAGISFATGTSWGTMGILTPLMIFVTHRLLAAAAPVDPNDPILLATIGAVLAGSIFGDHCSPISDTTVLSSMASGCDHLDHVATQLPYALLVAAVSIVLGYLPSGLLAGTVFGNPYVLLAAASVSLVVVLGVLGRRPESPP